MSSITPSASPHPWDKSPPTARSASPRMAPPPLNFMAPLPAKVDRSPILVREATDGKMASIFLKFASNALRNEFLQQKISFLDSIAIRLKPEYENTLRIKEDEIIRSKTSIPTEEMAEDTNQYVDVFVTNISNLDKVREALEGFFKSY